MKALSALVLGVFALGLAAGAVADEKDYPKLIVGKWEITKSDLAPVGSVVEFTKDGKLMAVVKDQGQELKLEGTYKVDKDKLNTKIKLPCGNTTDDTDTIKMLTDESMEIENSMKKVTAFKRKK
jgi:uncharacterized protein (TIGR03066 family)